LNFDDVVVDDVVRIEREVLREVGGKIAGGFGFHDLILSFGFQNFDTLSSSYFDFLTSCFLTSFILTSIHRPNTEVRSQIEVHENFIEVSRKLSSYLQRFFHQTDNFHIVSPSLPLHSSSTIPIKPN
jgi:hypothetical protein